MNIVTNKIIYFKPQVMNYIYIDLIILIFIQLEFVPLYLNLNIL